MMKRANREVLPGESPETAEPVQGDHFVDADGNRYVYDNDGNFYDGDRNPAPDDAKIFAQPDNGADEKTHSYGQSDVGSVMKYARSQAKDAAFDEKTHAYDLSRYDDTESLAVKSLDGESFDKAFRQLPGVSEAFDATEAGKPDESIGLGE